MPPMKGEHNFKATWSLLQLLSYDPQEALIALFASDEPIETETRRAILEALIADREKDPHAMKLRLVRPRHRPRTQSSELELVRRLHRIGKLADSELAKPNAVPKNVFADIAEREGISDTEVRESLKAWTNRKFNARQIPRNK